MKYKDRDRELRDLQMLKEAEARGITVAELEKEIGEKMYRYRISREEEIGIIESETCNKRYNEEVYYMLSKDGSITSGTSPKVIEEMIRDQIIARASKINVKVSKSVLEKLKKLSCLTPNLVRSEERRVGKECRSGWSKYN